MDAAITCAICQEEESFRVGWDLYDFRKNPTDSKDHLVYNICDFCVNVIKTGKTTTG
jgi:hypothetical protein